MDILTVNWTTFKSLAVSKYARIQFLETSRQYTVFFYDGPAKYQVELFKENSGVDGVAEPQNTNDRIDFETSYKATCNLPIEPRTSDGMPKFLPSVAVDDVSIFVKGARYTVTGADSVCDISFNYIIKLQGVNISIKGGEWGDNLTFSIGYIDAQNNWVNLKTFGESVYTKDIADWADYAFKNNAVATIPAGLKLRLVYNQVNTNTIKQVIVHYLMHK